MCLPKSTNVMFSCNWITNQPKLSDVKQWSHIYTFCMLLRFIWYRMDLAGGTFFRLWLLGWLSYTLKSASVALHICLILFLWSVRKLGRVLLMFTAQIQEASWKCKVSWGLGLEMSRCHFFSHAIGPNSHMYKPKVSGAEKYFHSSVMRPWPRCGCRQWWRSEIIQPTIPGTLFYFSFCECTILRLIRSRFWLFTQSSSCIRMNFQQYCLLSCVLLFINNILIFNYYLNVEVLLRSLL